VLPKVTVPPAPPTARVVAAPKALTVVAVELRSAMVVWLVARVGALRLIVLADCRDTLPAMVEPIVTVVLEVAVVLVPILIVPVPPAITCGTIFTVFEVPPFPIFTVLNVLVPPPIPWVPMLTVPTELPIPASI
jgi:hypothetical protein